MAANFNVPAPEPMAMTGNKAQNWLDFRAEWEDYSTATGLASKLKNEDGSPNAQGLQQSAATLRTVMGRECVKILRSLPTIPEAEKDNPQSILAALSDHFVPQRNLLFDRYKFNTANQLPDESSNDYVIRLRRLAAVCEFGALSDSLIRDRIVIGTTDSATRDRLFRERPVPNLATCAEYLQAAELTRHHKKQMSATPTEDPNVDVDYLQRDKYRKTAKENNAGQQPGSCGWCGKEKHSRANCPARNSTCDNCGKAGHYRSVCRSSSAKPNIQRHVQEVNTSLSFLGDVHLDEVDESEAWNVTIAVNGHPTMFKLDSGAAVTVLGDHTPWLRKVQLRQSDKTLRGAGNTVIPVIGMLHAQLKHKEQQLNEDVYIVASQKTPLLSRQACQKLQLLTLSVNELQAPADPNFRAEYPDLFTGLGLLKTSYHITLREDVEPVCLYAPRKVPHPLLPSVITEIDSMVERGVISPVTVPTKWCAGMVCVPKPSGAVRICVDLTGLNKAVQRETHPMASVDDSLSKLKGSKIFSKLDANSGFWQLPLDEESKLLTTFICPERGRFAFNRLPFGISSASEIFQRTMSQILEGIPGTICHMDDILIHAESRGTHNTRVRQVLERLQNAGLTLNDKCEFSASSIKFLGHIVSAAGIQADPSKVEAIAKYPPPTNIKELQRFLGMINQTGKFLPHMASHTEPLRCLLQQDTDWLWDQPQQTAFQSLKDLLISADTLAHYDPSKDTVVAADASNAGIGAVLLQVQTDTSRRPVCYASRSLTETEQRYAVIEKEALAATWACEKFADYVTGLEFSLETDHRPLVPLLSTTDLSRMPARILRFRLRMMRFSPTIRYVEGKNQRVADALSRAPVGEITLDDTLLVEEVGAMASQAVNSIPATPCRLQQILKAQRADEEVEQLKEFVKTGWPSYMPQLPSIRPYWEVRAHLTVTDDLLLYDDRLVIPETMRPEILRKLHEGHLGITKCRARARESVWWPSVSQAIGELTANCHTCALSRPPGTETLMPSSFPSRPWERVGTDLFCHKNRYYVLVVDYFSRWAEVRALETSQTSADVVNKMKSIFATHGIPDIVVSDNGPQYNSATFQSFAKAYDFSHVTSSPRYPQSNGEAERAVQTVKALLTKNDSDPYLGLLAYRTAPLENGFSPAELLMGRQLNSRLPVIQTQLEPNRKDRSSLGEKEQVQREKQRTNFNRRHRARDLNRLSPGDSVWVRDLQRHGQVSAQSSNPRSYEVQSGNVTLRRNRSALVATPGMLHQPAVAPHLESSPVTPHRDIPDQVPPLLGSNHGSPEQVPSPTGSRQTRSGRQVKTPHRLNL